MEKRLQADLVSAMKNKDAVKLASLRAIKTAITMAKTAPDAPSELTEGDIQKIIQKLVKQRKDSADQYTAAGRQDLADFMIKSFGSAKNTQPMWDYVKLETTGRKIGQKPE